jgi:hypothetical protein
LGAVHRKMAKIQSRSRLSPLKGLAQLLQSIGKALV